MATDAMTDAGLAPEMRDDPRIGRFDDLAGIARASKALAAHAVNLAIIADGGRAAVLMRRADAEPGGHRIYAIVGDLPDDAPDGGLDGLDPAPQWRFIIASVRTT